jgi:hypothetical protein
MQVIVGMLLGLLVGLAASFVLVVAVTSATDSSMGAFLPGVLTLLCVMVGGVIGGQRSRARRPSVPPDQWGGRR